MGFLPALCGSWLNYKPFTHDPYKVCQLPGMEWDVQPEAELLPALERALQSHDPIAKEGEWLDRHGLRGTFPAQEKSL
jgi:hypothetical protein